MGGALIANDLEGNCLEDDDAMFCSQRSFFEFLKGYMIRAAIAYLEDLQSRRLTKKRLIYKGMLASAHIDTEPEVVVGIYGANIQEGINLLNTWVREHDPSAPDPRFHLPCKRLVMHYESMMATGYPLDSWTDDQNYNYHLGPIKGRNAPVVLKKLKMTGLWRYCLCFGGLRLERHHCQEIVVFLDRVMPFLKKQLDAKGCVSGIKDIKRVFELCPEDGSVGLE